MDGLCPARFGLSAGKATLRAQRAPGPASPRPSEEFGGEENVCEEDDGEEAGEGQETGAWGRRHTRETAHEGGGDVKNAGAAQSAFRMSSAGPVPLRP
ncbi:hypothetical protein CCS38_00540 [Streptomyces purpurogeneiscleroticus]|nr:hypothetical protein [Streptomyces purpurogeneiscleroticus]